MIICVRISPFDGTHGDDTLIGNDNQQDITGLGGNDIIVGKGMGDNFSGGLVTMLYQAELVRT